MMAGPELWTSAEFADYAKVTVAQVAHLRRTGRGPTFIRIGKHVRYVPGVVHRWVLDRQQSTTVVDAK